MNPEIKRRIEQIRRGDVPEEYKKAIVGTVSYTHLTLPTTSRV